MRVSHLLASVGAIVTLSAGAALAAEGCECCKDMAADAEMSCCDKMKAEPVPPSPTPDQPQTPDSDRSPTPEA